MAIYVGEAVTIFATAEHPVTREPIVDLTGTLEFYAPGKDPKNVVGDRTADHTGTMTYDANAEGYVGTVSTAGWESGRWTVRVKFDGTFASWEYSAFTIKP